MLSLTDLPIEIIYEICSRYLSRSVLRKLFQLNRHFQNLCHNGPFKKLYQRKLKQKTTEWFREFKDFDTMILHAAFKSKLDVLKFLLHDKQNNLLCDPDSPLVPNWILLDTVRAGKLNSLRLLFQFAQPNLPIDILWKACEYGHVNILKFLLADPRFNPDHESCQALILACVHENIDCVKVLIQDKRVNPAARNNFCFRYACKENIPELVELFLLQPSVNPAAHDNDALIEACSCGNVQIVQRLLQLKSISPESQDNLALRIASERWNVQIVKLLWRDSRVRRQHLFCYNVQARLKISAILDLDK